MTIPLTAIVTILVAHFIADWILQSREVADNKSKNNGVLALHCVIYGFGLYFATSFLNIFFKFSSDDLISIWTIINVIAHFVTDFITSRATSAMYKEERYREFFLIIGLDQLIHGFWLFISFVAIQKYFL